MTDIALAVGGFVVIFAVVALVLMRASGRGQARRLEAVTHGEVHADRGPRPTPLGGRPDLAPWFTQRLSGSPFQRRLQADIIRAGLLLRPGELLAISVLAALIGGAIGLLFLGVLGAALGIAALGLAPWACIMVLQVRRKARLMAQLPDALDMLCASVRTGYGFVQAVGTVADQLSSPIKDEAQRLIDEVSLGLSLDAGLQRMMERTGQPDVEILCSAVQIQTRTGGNLAEVLDNIGRVIRGRMQLAGEVQALTAEGRMSALVLLSLPFAMAGVLSYMSPGWLGPLFAGGLGTLLLGLGAVAMVLGILWMRKLLTIDI